MVENVSKTKEERNFEGKTQLMQKKNKQAKLTS